MEMMRSGMDIARFNFSHGTHEEQEKRINLVKAAAEAVGKPIALMADTKGPEVRLGIFVEGSVLLAEGQEFYLTTEEISGDAKKSSVNYDGLPAEVSVGEKILLDDGKLILEVTAVEGKEIYTKVIHGGKISSRKRVAVPAVNLKIPFMSEQDKADLAFAVRNNMDYVAASFVRSAEDVLCIRRELEQMDSQMRIIAKIENRSGVDNIDAILQVVDGVMVARGDLGVEIPAEEVPLVQKKIIAACNKAGKPVITATQMLESMIQSYRATRAEASDVANSIFDGTDVIMLSGETANGKYPLEAVQTMARIARFTDEALDYEEIFEKKGLAELTNTTDAISHASVQVAHELDANSIVTITESGYTARMTAKYRPVCPIIAVSPREQSLRRMQLYWGVIPVLGPFSTSTDELMEGSLEAGKKAGLIADGDLVVVTAGVPVGEVGSTNIIKVMHMATKILSGVGVGRNSVTGKACIVRTAKDLERLNPESIIVVRGMENEMGAAAAKCAGIVSEEGGFTCGAAIVGINCRIPTIVGASGATEKIADGQEITLDVAGGIIYDGRMNVK